MTNALNTQPVIRPQIADRFLRELPRFFGEGLTSMLREALQNAHRAQATLVDVSFDEQTRVLRVTDNGIGLSDPQVLLTGGATGWDESSVIEPAGLGVFSYLNPNVVTRADFRSRAWRVTLTPDVLNTPLLSVPVERADELSGFQVQLHLADSVKMSELPAAITAAYGYFTFEMTQNGRRVTPGKLARDGVRAEADTAFGPVGLATNVAGLSSGERRATAYVLWEGQAIPLPELSGAVEAYAKTMPSPWKYGFSGSYGAYSLLWRPAAHLRMRPKLPDRRTMIVDGGVNFEVVARHLLDAAVAAHDARLAQVIADFPPTLTFAAAKLTVDRDGLKVDDAKLRGLLRSAGFQQTATADIPAPSKWNNRASVTVDSGEGDTYVSSGSTIDVVELWTRAGQPVDDDSAALTLTTIFQHGSDMHGLITDREYITSPLYALEGASLTLDLHGGDMEAIDRIDGPIAFVPKITVGEWEMPYLLRSDSPYVVIAGTPQEGIETALANETVMDWIFSRMRDDDSLGSWIDGYDRGGEFTASDIESSLSVYVARLLAPENVADEIDELNKHIGKLDAAMSALKDHWTDLKHDSPLAAPYAALREARAPLAARKEALLAEYPLFV